MNRNEIEELLPGYLEDELSAEARRQVEAAMAADPALSQEVASLRRALAELRSITGLGGESPALPERSFAFGSPGESRGATPRSPRRAWSTALRYAAVIGLAFVGGYAARGPTELPPSTGAPIQDEIAQRVAAAWGDHPAQSGMARSLIAVSRALHDPEQAVRR